MKTLNDIRSSFIDFFKKNGHSEKSSSPLVPLNDPTLMFTNAGMVPFKDIFTGQVKSDLKRVVSSQKCVRAGGKHNDLDNVGYTGRHLTFFEMLGNFSFGDYFKEEAIKYAWNFITSELALPKHKLYVTVYHEDFEAEQFWKKVTGFSEDRIIKISTNDNFWSMGDTGPCGPCSEIFYDHGDKVFGSLPGTKHEDGDRYVEIWNLVFMQFEKMVGGSMVDLPHKSIDTGMGLERISAVVQGVQDNYQTDLFKFLINASEEISGRSSKGELKFSHRVIADHLRSASFLIGDGVMPSNEGRGYVLRRIIRRAVMHVNKLGYKDTMLEKMVPALTSQMGSAFPEIIRAEELIKEVLNNEEQGFRRTIDKGMSILESAVSKMNNNVFSGEIAFKLHDTYGFPLDLTQAILRDRKISVDTERFDQEMEVQKSNARKAWSGSGGNKVNDIWFKVKEVTDRTEFIGYSSVYAKGKVEVIVYKDKLVEFVNGQDEFFLVTNQTPFYGESGGQMGDIGSIKLENTEIEVLDTQKKFDTIHIHKCRLKKGLIKIGDEIDMIVDSSNRSKLKANHTATHLLHAALRNHLGEHVVQKGSLVAADKLRFDFSSAKPVPFNILRKIESEINEVITKNLPVSTVIQKYDEALNSGAMALFGEKYDDEVRVVYIGEKKSNNKFSVELCGGTHVSHLSEIGSFQIISESSVASGIRRIEAITNSESLNKFIESREQIHSLTEFLKTSKDELFEKVSKLHIENKALKRDIMKAKIDSVSVEIDHDENKLDFNGGVALVSFVEDLTIPDLKQVISNFSKKNNIGVIALVSKVANSLFFSVVVDKSLSQNILASDISKIITSEFGLKGGGNALFAQGGGLCDNVDEKNFKQKIFNHIKAKCQSL